MATISTTVAAVTRPGTNQSPRFAGIAISPSATTDIPRSARARSAQIPSSLFSRRKPGCERRAFTTESWMRPRPRAPPRRTSPAIGRPTVVLKRFHDPGEDILLGTLEGNVIRGNRQIPFAQRAHYSVKYARSVTRQNFVGKPPCFAVWIIQEHRTRRRAWPEAVAADVPTR